MLHIHQETLQWRFQYNVDQRIQPNLVRQVVKLRFSQLVFWPFKTGSNIDVGTQILYKFAILIESNPLVVIAKRYDDYFGSYSWIAEKTLNMSFSKKY